MDEDKTGNNHRSSEKRFLLGKKLTWEEQLTVVRTMFPFVSTKAALQDKHFAKGYAYSCRIFAMERREEWTSMKQYLEPALTEYQRSYEEAGTPEAIANLLWALCLGYTLALDVETVGAESEEYTRDCYETGLLMIEILREYKAYEALAEYYNTLLHVIGMDGNGRE
jgi:hypothetical protein